MDLSGAARGSPDDELVTHLPLTLKPDPRRVVIRPFTPADDDAEFASPTISRAQRIADRVLAMPEEEVAAAVAEIVANLQPNHRDIEAVLLRRFHDVNGLLIKPDLVTPNRARLIGSYFSEEYSFEAAALFNPSIVPHPDQTGAPARGLRFILSLRGVGEGSVSSVTFRTGAWSPTGGVTVDTPSQQAITPRIEYVPGGEPDDPGVHLICDDSRDISEIVIFPITSRQRNGIEDLRLVPFVDDDGRASVFGTYTAFDGRAIRQELLHTVDFRTFDMSPLHGGASNNKGMALFPRRIGGRYAMLGRQDHETVRLLMSDDLYDWRTGVVAVAPRWPWEFVQIGNCGSPIEIEEGWLVLIHGVGPVRNYSLGACLLDKTDPSKLLGRLTSPLLKSNPHERSGYVPNVLYSCGPWSTTVRCSCPTPWPIASPPSRSRRWIGCCR